MSAPPDDAPEARRPTTEAELLALFDRLGVAHRTFEHRPVFTVEESRDLKAQIPGGHTKNLFLKDKKGALFLLCALSDTAIDLNAVSKLIGAGRFSFGNADLLMLNLGVTPGSVTLFALINDNERNVTLLLDEALFAHDPVNFHPLRNDATTSISPSDMMKFIRALGREPIRLAFDAAGAPMRIEPGAWPAHLTARTRDRMSFTDGAAPAETDIVKDGSDQGFMSDVIERSRQAPVIVDFWAPWCGPCRTLGPPLEKAVRAAGGKVRLVKINIDEHPGVAGQLGVRSIPAVYAFDQGRPVDGFMGAVPESQIKLFVDRLAGASTEEDIGALLEQAAESLSLGDMGGAAQSYAAALQVDPANAKAIAGMARVYLTTGDAEQARAVLEMAPPEKANDSDIAGVRAALDLAAAASDAGDSGELRAKIAGNPNDLQARYDLAEALSARGDFEGASEHLLAVIAKNRDWNEGAARNQLLKVFDAAGAASEVAKQGRRKLSAILFS